MLIADSRLIINFWLTHAIFR